MNEVKPTTEIVTHTPGPWTVAPGRDGVIATVKIGDGDRFTVYLGSSGAPTAEWNANARVISAAPDMLQALHEIADDCYVRDGEPDSTAHCRFCDHSEGARHDIDCVMGFINRAIAKAEGVGR